MVTMMSMELEITKIMAKKDDKMKSPHMKLGEGRETSCYGGVHYMVLGVRIQPSLMGGVM